jgi:hypothetical protein
MDVKTLGQHIAKPLGGSFWMLLEPDLMIFFKSHIYAAHTE